MCSVFGALVHAKSRADVVAANRILKVLYERSKERGRDGRGWHMRWTDYNFTLDKREHRSILPADDRSACEVTPAFHEQTEWATLVGNMRAEPTTEYVKDKQVHDQQPYNVDRWSVVHNGTIANDKELRQLVDAHPSDIDSAVIPELLAKADRDFGDGNNVTDQGKFKHVISLLKGSYAILATTEERDQILVACNYRPVWYIETPFGLFFGSSRRVFPPDYTPKMVEPYTVHLFRFDDGKAVSTRFTTNFRDSSFGAKALVVCSGGLDSVVSAAQARAQGYDIELIHFLYGSRAEGPEVKAVQEVAAALGCKVTLFPLPVYSKKDSPLLDPDSKVAGGEAGAEFAHEWVPARNLLLLSVATAYAEANGFETLVLGNNLEEAGAYPDNEPEFIDKFNDLLPFAIGDGKKLRVIMPVGNMMKHEIVKLGLRNGAPMHLTWSCYRAGELHCGTCGPCFMRRTAFNINNATEVIPYAV